jgi:hypothetical protein
MTSGVIYFSGKVIYCRSEGLPQPMTSGVVYFSGKDIYLPLCGAAAANDQWGRLFIYRKSYIAALWGLRSQ